MNTLMAGTRPVRSSRGQYTVAGNAARAFAREREEREARAALYIADVPAGSRQDELRDFNRAGYRVSRPWHDEAFALPDVGGAVPLGGEAAPQRHRPQQRPTFVERMIAQARREKRDAALCAVLFLCILMLTAAWGQRQVELRRVSLGIQRLQEETVMLEQESEQLTQQIALAKNDERIRNLAQNELNMLRPERAQTQTIYIQAEDSSQRAQAQQTQESGMELLDILLGLLDVCHIGE